MPRGEPMQEIERSTLATLVAKQIRSSILQGAFAPGSQLSEIALAERFAVSRGPVREALQALVQDGLLKREPHRGVFVPVITDADVVDIYRAREAIEAAAVKYVIASGSGATARASLEAIVAEMESAAAAERWDEVAELDMRFHAEVVRFGESPRLERLYGTLIDETQLCLMMTVATPVRGDLVDEHRELAALLTSEDPQPAVDAVAQHMRVAIETLRLQRTETVTAWLAGDA